MRPGTCCLICRADGCAQVRTNTEDVVEFIHCTTRRQWLEDDKNMLPDSHGLDSFPWSLESDAFRPAFAIPIQRYPSAATSFLCCKTTKWGQPKSLDRTNSVLTCDVPPPLGISQPASTTLKLHLGIHIKVYLVQSELHRICIPHMHPATTDWKLSELKFRLAN